MSLILMCMTVMMMSAATTPMNIQKSVGILPPQTVGRIAVSCGQIQHGDERIVSKDVDFFCPDIYQVGIVVIMVKSVQVSAQATTGVPALHALSPCLVHQSAGGAPGNAHPLADTLVGMICYPTLFTAFSMASIFA